MTTSMERLARRPSTAWCLAGLTVMTLGTCTIVLAATGAANTVSLPGLSAPDTVVPWLLPLVTAFGILAQTLTVGLLLVAILCLPRVGNSLSTEGWTAARYAAVAAGVWFVTQVALVALTTADLIGIGLSDLTLSQLISTAVQVTSGRQILVAGLALLCCAMAAMSLSSRGSMIALAAALLALVPQATSGHAASAGSHQIAVSSLLLHLVGIVGWAGGLVALSLTAHRLSTPTLATAARRFSAVAAPAAALVVLSGFANAAVRLGFSTAWFSSSYGTLVLLKSAGAVVLLGIGALHRRRTLGLLEAGTRSAFTRLAAVEVALFASILGLAVGLSRTAPPSTGRSETPAEALLGFPMPARITLNRVLLDWYPEPIFLAVAGVAGILYLGGVRRLRRRDVSWPVYRTVLWFVGLLVVVVATSSGLARYALVLAWGHMVQHLLLSMVAAWLLVLASPMTLALRALRPATDPNLPGPREMLRGLTEGRLARFVSSPLIAGPVFALSPFAFYLTGLYGLALRSHVAHLLVSAHFLLAGLLFFWVVIGLDPAPKRPHPAIRVVLVLFAAVAHTIFGIALMQSTGSLAPDWFASIGRPWGPGPGEDSRIAGGVAWAFGEVPFAIVLLVVMVQWMKSDEREQRRRDRDADRQGSGEQIALANYNAVLEELARRKP